MKEIAENKEDFGKEIPTTASVINPVDCKRFSGFEIQRQLCLLDDRDDEDDAAKIERIITEERNRDPLLRNCRKVEILFEEDMLQPDHYKSLMALLQHILLDSCYDDWFTPVKKLPDSGSTDPVSSGNLD
jgi:hypothetical protein